MRSGHVVTCAGVVAGVVGDVVVRADLMTEVTKHWTIEEIHN